MRKIIVLFNLMWLFILFRRNPHINALTEAKERLKFQVIIHIFGTYEVILWQAYFHLFLQVSGVPVSTQGRCSGFLLCCVTELTSQRIPGGGLHYLCSDTSTHVCTLRAPWVTGWNPCMHKGCFVPRLLELSTNTIQLTALKPLWSSRRVGRLHLHVCPH